nr:hypothetical protein [Tanacetum cinerariifolium]
QSQHGAARRPSVFLHPHSALERRADCLALGYRAGDVVAAQQQRVGSKCLHADRNAGAAGHGPGRAFATLLWPPHHAWHHALGRGRGPHWCRPDAPRYAGLVGLLRYHLAQRDGPSHFAANVGGGEQRQRTVAPQRDHPDARLRCHLHWPVSRRARRARLREHAATLPHRRRVQGRCPRRHQARRQGVFQDRRHARNPPRKHVLPRQLRGQKEWRVLHAVSPRASQRGDGRHLGFAGVAALPRARYLLAHHLSARPAQGAALEPQHPARAGRGRHHFPKRLLRRVPGHRAGARRIALQADMIISGEKGRQYHAHPVFVLRDRQVGSVPDEVEDLGLRLTLNQIDPVKGRFTFGVSTTAKDYIVLKATEKPFINLLWGG